MKLNPQSKTVFALHKEKSNLKRYREFSQQNTIEAYPGLKEILSKKDLDQVLKEHAAKLAPPAEKLAALFPPTLLRSSTIRAGKAQPAKALAVGDSMELSLIPNDVGEAFAIGAGLISRRGSHEDRLHNSLDGNGPEARISR